MRPFLVTLAIGVVLLPGAQHGIADLIDPHHGMHGHCHLVFEEHVADGEVHVHGGHGHGHEHEHAPSQRPVSDPTRGEPTAVGTQHERAHDTDGGPATSDAIDGDGAHARVVMPLPCSAPDHDEPCPHAPLEGGHHSHAMPPMLTTSAPSALAVWSAPRSFAYGLRARQLHGRASPRSLDRPPRV